MNLQAESQGPAGRVQGEYLNRGNERCYVIRNVNRLPPFFISVVSDDDHWLFASSNGGLTAGRISPDTALFPYLPVDKIHDSTLHTGSRTLLRIHGDAGPLLWEPFNPEHTDRYPLTRNLHKNTLGNKLCFEEINHHFGLAFRYTWMTSKRYGFVRHCELANAGKRRLQVDVLDGLQNLLPAETPLVAQTNSSNLVDAYKWSELDEHSGLGIFALYSAITDRAEPAESLKATTVFCLGLNSPTVLLSSSQLESFRRGAVLQQERRKRGIRCAYLINTSVSLPAGEKTTWRFVSNVQQSQKEVVSLRRALRDPGLLDEAISADIQQGSERLTRLVASADGLQATAEEHVAAHHYANVLFNVLRGGILDEQQHISSADLTATIRHFNRGVFKRHQALLEQLPTSMDIDQVLSILEGSGDAQLMRLAGEYLPITFGRRHGDPSRPWNRFEIRLRDEHGNQILSYAGNWRDIFQNWEALAMSFPQFIENMIAKFVNASTMDGYNPYRVMKEGIDWEVEDPDDPWSYIGYWGDHQIIYLQKLLELSARFHPARLPKLLHRPLFCFANVPYRIKPFDQLLIDPKNTVDFDSETARVIEQRVAEMGADGKLVLDRNGAVFQVNLFEKLLVPLLAKLGNLVVDGGIWLNTQRPEWNDANNALVGHGLSMVTLCYMRRYVAFLVDLIAEEQNSFALSEQVARWLSETAEALTRLRAQSTDFRYDARIRHEGLMDLGQAASRYRNSVYEGQGFSGRSELWAEDIRRMLSDVLQLVDHTIAGNWRDDGLFNAYNLMLHGRGELEIQQLYPMLEGQVAVLSSGALAPSECISVVETLFHSLLYRADQDSFLLYPDRELPTFLEKNRISQSEAETLPFLDEMLARGDERIVLRDDEGCYRFSAEFRNVKDLHSALDDLVGEYGAAAESARELLVQLYEKVFNHKAFTGRSGTMFGFEGLGSIYWHMVAKLLLAVQENFFSALDQDDAETTRKLAQLYYRVRKGLGFNKTPWEYGAFPSDPYSHTPGHSGAQQPGMTGQVKEEIITRFGELGVRVNQGIARFEPALLSLSEFSERGRTFRYPEIGGDWRQLELLPHSLVFTWCQVPVIYHLDDTRTASLVVVGSDGRRRDASRTRLSAQDSAELFSRSGRISRLELTFPRAALLSEAPD